MHNLKITVCATLIEKLMLQQLYRLLNISQTVAVSWVYY